MTSPDGKIPEGAYVGTAGQSNSLGDLNSLTEAEAKNRMRAQVEPTFNRQRDGIWGLMNSAMQVVTGTYTGTVKMFVDGQLALKDRMDLLAQTGYCCAYMSQSLRLGPVRNRALPFDAYIGPHQDAELATVWRDHPNTGGPRNECCIRLNRPGLWRADVSFVHAGDGYDTGFAEITILRPDLSIYSVSTLPDADRKADGGNAGDVYLGTPVVLGKSFVVPDSGYYAQVRWQFNTNVGIRTAKGGAQLSQFSVTQWSPKIANANTSDVSVGTISDTG